VPLSTVNSLRLSLLLLLVLSLPLVAQPRVEEERPLARAVREASLHLAQGDHAWAVATLEAALDSARPGEPHAEALAILATANFAAGHYRPALDVARDFAFNYPGHARSSAIDYIRGVSAFQEGNLDEARMAFHRAHAREVEPFRSDAAYWLAKMHAAAGNLDSSEFYAGRYLGLGDAAAGARSRIDPLWPQALIENFADDALYISAWIKEGRNSIDSAAALYRKILDDYPASELQLDAQLRLGVIEARRGHYESALNLLTSLTPRTERQREEQLFYMAEAASALERHEQALGDYRSYLREFPASKRDRAARYGAGWSEQMLTRYDDAIATYRQLADAHDSIAAASLYQIGAIQTLRADTAGAVRTFESLVYRLPYESFSDNAYYQLGRIFYRRQDFDSARHYLNIAARQFPDSEIRLEAYYLLAESYAALGDWRNAQYSFQRTRQLGATGPMFERALFREGVMLYRLGQFRSALDRLREYVAEHNEGEDIAGATFWLAEALYQDGAYEESERYFAAHLERFPTSTETDEALYGLAWARFMQRDFAGAATSFEQFIETYPEHRSMIDATIRLADAYRFTKQWTKAITIYESIEDRVGKSARAEEARYRLAEAFIEMGEVERAVAAFRSLVTYYPDSPRRDVYAFNVGSLYNEREIDTMAIAELQSFITEYPESRLLPQAHYMIGDSYYNMQQYDSAFAWYYSVLEKYPSSTVVPEAMEAVRFSLGAAGRGREALAVIDTFMARNPDRLPADSLGFRKGMIVFDEGAYGEAIPMFARVVTDFPKSGLVPDALFQIGLSHEYTGAVDSALVYFGDVVENHPQSAGAQKALLEQGAIRMRRKDPHVARASFELFIERFPASARLTEARYGLASALLSLADTAGALEQFHLIVDSTRSEDDLLVDRSRLMVARLAAIQGRRDEALGILAAVVARRLDDIAAEALLLRGELLMAANDLSGALAELRRLQSDFADYVDYTEPGLLLLGDLYVKLTNYQAARETWTQLVDQTENAKLRADAEARLKKLKR
jgi:TolA-binding protein